MTLNKRKSYSVRIAICLVVACLGLFLTDSIYKNLYLPLVADPPVRIAFCNFDQYFLVCSKQFGRVIIYDENFRELYQIEELKSKVIPCTVLPSNRLPLVAIWDNPSNAALLFFRPENYDLVHLDENKILSLHDDFDSGVTQLIVEDGAGTRSLIEIKQTLADSNSLPIQNDDTDVNPPIYSFNFNEKFFKCSDKHLLSAGRIWEEIPLVKTGFGVGREKLGKNSISLHTMIEMYGEERPVRLEPTITAQGGHLAVGYEKIAFLSWKNDQIYSWIFNGDEFRFESPKSKLNWNYFPKFRFY